jgi:16S rRNA (uracil1498-N3)-methyltransferase
MGRAHHRRFLVPPEAVGGGQVTFSPDQARQFAAVLRLREGDLVTVFDGVGREWMARLTLTTPRRAAACLLEEASGEPPPRLRLTLAQVVPRGAAMDLIVAKATELGVWRIVPLEAERSVRRASASGQSARWRRIVAEATEQCGRRTLPDLAEPCTLDALLRSRAKDEPLLACDNGDGAVPLLRVCRTLTTAAALTVLVGGEGGLSSGEVGRVKQQGGRLVGLGPRLLRAETAALAALAVLQASLGDWAGPNGAS